MQPAVVERGLGEFNQNKWYCTLALRIPTGSSKRKQLIRVDENDNTSEATKRVKLLDGEGGTVTEKRTFIYHSQDPIGHVARLNKMRKSHAHHTHEIVTVLGPFAHEDDAKLVCALWGWKSRAVLPRAVWAEVLADKFGARLCHNMNHIVSMQHFDCAHRGAHVYLYPKKGGAVST
jgi:hypothetical protein